MEEKIHSFKKLNAYIEAKKLVQQIYEVVSKLPHEERYALADQLRRAVISVPSNIVEGMSRISDKEKAHFLEIAYAITDGSLLSDRYSNRFRIHSS